MSFDTFVSAFLNDNSLAAIDNCTTWPEMERLLGRVYFGLGSYFSQADYSEVPPDYDGVINLAIPPLPRAQGVATVRYLAANFRGLYQRDGRQTILVPCGGFRQAFPTVKSHRVVHELYMDLLTRKSRSINQLFIANTKLTTIRISFTAEGSSTVTLTNKHADFQIGNDIAQLWGSALTEWQRIILAFLTSPNDETKKQAIEICLATTREQVKQAIVKYETNLLAAPFFAGWQKLLHEPPLETIGETTDRFHHWLSSISWLAFHCNPANAGAHFYSVCLPNLLESSNASERTGVDSILPRSSISVVAEQELPESFLGEWRMLPTVLCNNSRYQTLGKSAQQKFRIFESLRIKRDLPGEEGILARHISEHSKYSDRRDPSKSGSREVNGRPTLLQDPILPVDFGRIDFLLRTARLLVGQRHEGHPLHFCFIFGFSWERIDSESKGAIDGVVSGLRDQWLKFWTNVVQPTVTKKIGCWSPDLLDGIVRQQVLGLVADGMAKWVKTSDLPLQPWETALFFEEDESVAWPVPTNIVRIHGGLVSQSESIATEFQLRKALANLTMTAATTVAVLAGDSGLILFVRGKAILLPCKGGTDFESPFLDVRLWENRVDRDRFVAFLHERLSSGTFSNAGAREGACELIADLCEALVTLGHGALMVVRKRNSSTKSLSPLNPVLTVYPELNAPKLSAKEGGILLYALLAALDGATEIQLPDGEGLISFVARRCVIPKEEIWVDTDATGAVLAANFQSLDPMSLVGKGTRHHSALALSKDLGEEAIVLTVSADGPVTIWRNGKQDAPVDAPTFQPRFKP